MESDKVSMGNIASKLHKVDGKQKIMGVQVKIISAYHRKQSKDSRSCGNIGYFP